MNQGNNDEMPEEIDFAGAVRGKYYARFHPEVSITTADGPLKLNALSTGEPAAVKIVALSSMSSHLDTRDFRSITPEVLSRSK